MADPKTLPIPDWGLRCPFCGASLAGLKQHMCVSCGKRFNILSLVADKRPILDVGLTCPTCDYSLTGLERERCPECGNAFSMRDMLEARGEPPVVGIDANPPAGTILADFAGPPDHHKQGEPSFTGREQPLPEFGLLCAECEQPLVGSVHDVCAACGHPFNLKALGGGEDWVRLNRLLPNFFSGPIRGILASAQIPHVVEGGTMRSSYPGIAPKMDLRVPREFLLDALHAIAAVIPREPAVETDLPDWKCAECGQFVPGNFGVCWECQSPRPDDAELRPTGQMHACRECGDRFDSDGDLCPDCLAEMGRGPAPADLTEFDEPEENDSSGWQCPACGQIVPAEFEVCWRCQAARQV